MTWTTDRARQLLDEGLEDPIPGPDGGSVRLRTTSDGVQLWRFGTTGDIETIIEQPVVLVPARDVSDARYRLLVDGVRLAVTRALAEGRRELYPADLVQPDVLLDPRLATAGDVADVLLDPIALSLVVGPFQLRGWLEEQGLPPVPDATAARLFRFRSDDLDSALNAARELVREGDVAAVPGLLATLESWIGFVEEPVWFTLDHRNAHRVLADAVATLVGNSPAPADRRRVVELFEAGLLGR